MPPGPSFCPCAPDDAKILGGEGSKEVRRLPDRGGCAAMDRSIEQIGRGREAAEEALLRKAAGLLGTSSLVKELPAGRFVVPRTVILSETPESSELAPLIEEILAPLLIRRGAR